MVANKNNNVMNETTRNSVMEALVRIKAVANNEDMELVTEECKNLVNQLLA